MADDKEQLVTHGSIHHKVAEAIKGCGPKVEEVLVNTLVDSEVNKRIQIAQTGLKALGALKADVKKLDRPDTVTHTVGGDSQAVYSDKLFKEIKQKREQLEKLERAFEKALNENTGEAYGELDKLSKNSGGGKGEAPAEA